MPGGLGLPDWLGVRFRATGDGRAEASLDPKPATLNLRGVAHGGTLATLADVAMAAAVNASAPASDLAITEALELHFLRPARDRLTAKARVLRMGRAVAVAQAEVHDGSGRLACTATGTFAMVAKRSERREGASDPAEASDA